MGHKHDQHHKKKRKALGSRKDPDRLLAGNLENEPQCLELVLKCDSEGSREAITSSLGDIPTPGVVVTVVSSGVGDINKNDLFMAGTASKLILGYEVEFGNALLSEIHKEGIEIRLYKVIYQLIDDLKRICELLTSEAGDQERILGRAKVIKLFKSCRKGIILGCEVISGRISRGDRFRVIGAMGQIYQGRVTSLHIERDAVDSAGKGRQVGLKIEDFQKAVVGDIVECVKYFPVVSAIWKPVPGITRIY